MSRSLGNDQSHSRVFQNFQKQLPFEADFGATYHNNNSKGHATSDQHSFSRRDRTLPQTAPSESATSLTSQVRQVNLGDANRMKRTLDSSPDNDEQKKSRKSPGSRLSRGDLNPSQRLPSSRPAQRTSYPPFRRKSSLSQSSDLKHKPSLEHKSSSLSSKSEPEEEGIQLQPETRPITQEQLVNEVKGIYAGLVMVEKKCVEIDAQQAATTNKLTNEQWQALIALHRTLLHEHHDFFLASQHPSASAALKRLATKYAMPARMWRHGIHSFLELLRHRLPDSLEHMLSFVYLAYSMMALLMESVPSFLETWIECLGDLARYRMAIEEIDMRDREVWAGVARMWYDKAADRSPSVGRIQHHLAVLARPNIVQQLFYYSKSLVSSQPFPNARDSIMLLFNPFLAKDDIASRRYAPVESTLVKAAAIQFTGRSIAAYNQLADQFVSFLNSHIGRTTAKFRTQGPEMASALAASLFNFGDTESVLWGLFAAYDDILKSKLELTKDGQTKTSGEPDPTPREGEQGQKDHPQSHADEKPKEPAKLNKPMLSHSAADSTTKDATFSGAPDAVFPASRLFRSACEIVFQRIGDKNCLPFCHVVLAFLHSLAHVPDALPYLEGQVPWESIVTFLNTVGRSGIVESRFEGPIFPQQLNGTGRQLPEDFVMRGLIWAKHYFPSTHFEGKVVDEDERLLELPSHAAPRAERCLWLGVQLSSVERWILYDSRSKRFSVTDLALQLEASRANPYDNRSPTMSVEREDTDTLMTGVQP